MTPEDHALVRVLATALCDIGAEVATDYNEEDTYVTVPVGYMRAIELELTSEGGDGIAFLMGRSWDVTHGLEGETLLEEIKDLSLENLIVRVRRAHFTFSNYAVALQPFARD